MPFARRSIRIFRCVKVPAPTHRRCSRQSVVPKNVAYTLFEYYLANKTDESEWVILPQVNFDAYFGNMKFSKTQLISLPGEFIERRLNNNGVSMYRIIVPS